MRAGTRLGVLCVDVSLPSLHSFRVNEEFVDLNHDVYQVPEYLRLFKNTTVCDGTQDIGTIAGRWSQVGRRGIRMHCCDTQPRGFLSPAPFGVESENSMKRPLRCDTLSIFNARERNLQK